MTDYEKRLEEFRMHYYFNYGIKLDDEVLFFYIRINEMQVDMKKEFAGVKNEMSGVKGEITNLKEEIIHIPRLVFRRSWDYFLYNAGKPSITFFAIGLAIYFTVIAITIFKRDYPVCINNGEPSLKIQYQDSTYYLPLNSVYIKK